MVYVLGMRGHGGALGPLLTISDDELTRPARRREDRDVLVLRIEIEAQRREVGRLMALLAGREPLLHRPPAELPAELGADRLLLSARDVRKALGISAGTLYRWVSIGEFPAQIHLGSMSRWKREDVDLWLRARTEAQASGVAATGAPKTFQRVRGGRSRWAATTATTPTVSDGYVRNWEPRPTPIRGSGWKLKAGFPEPVPADHPDYRVPRYRLADAANYVGLRPHQQWDLRDIPHGRTVAMHYCFAQSDLDDFKATQNRRGTKKPHAE